MKITWLGHSAFRLDFGSTAVLIDPFLTGNPTFKGNIDEVADGISHILLTHGHSDHVGDTLALAEKTRAKLVTNYDLGVYLSHQGLKNFDPMNTGGTTDQGTFTVTLTNALHSSADFHNGVSQALGSANGLIIKVKGGASLYHMGDTDMFADMALINEFHKPQIGIVPIGDRFTMGGDAAGFAVKKFFAFETVLPAHYATFGLLDQTADKFVAAMSGSKTTVAVPASGGSITV